MNFKKRNLEKLFIDAQYEKLKNVKVNRNDIILNAAAIQDQLLIDMGLKKLKKKIPKKKSKPNTNDLFTKNNDKDEIIDRRINFLNNLTFAERVGIKELDKKVPLSLNEWQQLENKTLQREDHKSYCPICLDLLSKRPTLLLSCSHIFHKVTIYNPRLVSQISKK
jgi:hypothetical protein